MERRRWKRRGQRQRPVIFSCLYFSETESSRGGCQARPARELPGSAPPAASEPARLLVQRPTLPSSPLWGPYKLSVLFLPCFSVNKSLKSKVEIYLKSFQISYIPSPPQASVSPFKELFLSLNFAWLLLFRWLKTEQFVRIKDRIQFPFIFIHWDVI